MLYSGMVIKVGKLWMARIRGADRFEEVEKVGCCMMQLTKYHTVVVHVAYIRPK